uniref:Uncharacterized protein n=1 Tax=Arundo donax TaxID=35708 RepID=A0A0A9GET6_ARUDO
MSYFEDTKPITKCNLIVPYIYLDTKPVTMRFSLTSLPSPSLLFSLPLFPALFHLRLRCIPA